MKGYLVVRHFKENFTFSLQPKQHTDWSNLLIAVFCNKEDAIKFIKQFYDLDSVSLIESDAIEMSATDLTVIAYEAF